MPGRIRCAASWCGCRPRCCRRASTGRTTRSIRWRSRNGAASSSSISTPTPARTPASSFDPASGDLGNWPLEELVSGHRFTKLMNCNWKIFWENFNECLHCPGVHKHLSQLVPIYGRGLMARHDDPEWERHADNDAPEFSGGAEGRRRDLVAGRPRARAEIPRPDRRRARGRPDLCDASAVDVRGRPCRLCPHRQPAPGRAGADRAHRRMAVLRRTRWRRTASTSTTSSRSACEVLEEDAGVCEINQRGLHSSRHEAGVLMPEEYDIHRFHEWVRGRHAGSCEANS